MILDGIYVVVSMLDTLEEPFIVQADSEEEALALLEDSGYNTDNMKAYRGSDILI